MLNRVARSLAVIGCVFGAGSAGAQSILPHGDDPTTPSRGVLRINVVSVWQRYDARFATNGTEPLGARFTSDSLGVANIPQLDTIQNAIAAAIGAPFKLDLG